MTCTAMLLYCLQGQCCVIFWICFIDDAYKQKPVNLGNLLQTLFVLLYL